jgi:myo-inositol catabolism protein IolH
LPVKVALDPYMHRRLSLRDMVHLVADLEYPFIELSPRSDFLPFFVHPRADSARVMELKNSLKETGVGLSSLLPLYRWSSPNEEERQAAVRYWKRAIEISVELECTVMNSEFSGRPEAHMQSEAAFWKSMEELLPIFDREGITLHLEPHPDDFVENGNDAVDLVRAMRSPRVKYCYCAPHTFHMGGDMVNMIKYAGPLLVHVHVADTFDHRASSGLRYIINPPGSPARVHQHTNIGQGEVDWDAFFGTLKQVGFDGIMTACVFAWEEKAIESSKFMRSEIRKRAGV